MFFVNNNNKSSSPNSSLYIIFSFNVFKFKFYCFVCKYVDPGTVINEQKVLFRAVILFNNQTNCRRAF